MSREYNYIRHPTHFRILWFALYGTLAVIFLIGLYFIVGRIRTHSLPTGQVELEVPYSKYLVGDKINFTVKNNFNSTIYSINHCPDEPLGIYKFISGKWQRLHAKANKDCADDERKISIPAHSSITASLAPWQSLFDEAGKYRLVVFVEYYNALPYQDIEIINKPKPKANNSSSNSASNNPSTSPNNVDTDGDEDDNGSTIQVNPTTYTVHVNSSGIYNVTSLNLKAGDSVKIIYDPPYHDEVRTRFVSGSVINFLTLDSEPGHTSGTRTFSSAGTWTFKADDHSGNTGTIVVK